MVENMQLLIARRRNSQKRELHVFSEKLLTIGIRIRTADILAPDESVHHEIKTRNIIAQNNSKWESELTWDAVEARLDEFVRDTRGLQVIVAMSHSWDFAFNTSADVFKCKARDIIELDGDTVLAFDSANVHVLAIDRYTSEICRMTRFSVYYSVPAS